MTCDILICTIGEGISKAALVPLPPQEGVHWIVSWQNPIGEIPQALQRADISVVTLDGKGLSRNRNHAIKYATSDICLIADDDVRYTPEMIASALQTFADDASLDVATFCYQSSGYPKQYPPFSFPLSEHPRNYYITSPELAFRRKSIQDRVQFNENVGLGSEWLGGGEEELFVRDALRMGLKCWFIPKTIVINDTPTTNTTRISRPETIRSVGATARVFYPCTYLLRLFVIAYRISRQAKLPFGHTLTLLRHGARLAEELNLL